MSHSKQAPKKTPAGDQKKSGAEDKIQVDGQTSTTTFQESDNQEGGGSGHGGGPGKDTFTVPLKKKPKS